MKPSLTVQATFLPAKSELAFTTIDLTPENVKQLLAEFESQLLNKLK